MVEGLVPPDAPTVNQQVGALCRQFVLLQQQVARYEAWLASVDLTQPPYSIADGGADMKSAVSGLNTTLQGQSMTFINRLVGLF